MLHAGLPTGFPPGLPVSLHMPSPQKADPVSWLPGQDLRTAPFPAVPEGAALMPPVCLFGHCEWLCLAQSGTRSPQAPRSVGLCGDAKTEDRHCGAWSPGWRSPHTQTPCAAVPSSEGPRKAEKGTCAESGGARRSFPASAENSPE